MRVPAAVSGPVGQPRLGSPGRPRAADDREHERQRARGRRRAARRASRVIGPAGPGIETCSSATPASARCQAAPSRVSRRGVAPSSSRCSSTTPAPVARSVTSAPAAVRVAVQVRPVRPDAARARRRAGTARAPTARSASAGSETAPSSSQRESAAGLDLPVDEVGAAREMQVQVPARREVARRSAGGGHDPERVLAAVRLARPRRCRGTPRARRRATTRRRCRSPRGGRARPARRRARSRRSTAGAASTSARSPGSAQNAMRMPSGDQAKLSTDQSPCVRRRARAPGRAACT